MSTIIPSRHLFTHARLFLAVAAATLATSLALAKSTPLPRVVHENGHHALLVDGKPFFILGGQAHNSSAWPRMLPQLWTTIDGLHANTLEVPLYWQQIEPQEGQFDFSVADMIVEQARAHGVRLVLLWFATWKNGNTDYTPDWVKLNPAKFPHVVDRNGKAINSASPHSKAFLDADTKAFTAVMKHLRDFDPQHTVIMMQVENEPGTYGSPRDFSPEAEKLFQAPVPGALLRPEVLEALHKPTGAQGTWAQVFGSDADEFFHAWSVATYINHVAAAGKAVYPLPMYVNVALEGEPGGAMAEVIPIYKAAAPVIDLLAPDIYQPPEKAMKTIASYDRADNPLFVPETFGSVDYLYEVIRRGGIGFSPFGVDRGQSGTQAESAVGAHLSAIATQYAQLRLSGGLLAKWMVEGKVQVATVSAEDSKQQVDLGGWQATIAFGSGRSWGPPPEPESKPKSKAAAPGPFGAPPPPSGRVVIAQLGPDEFVVMATKCRITFAATGAHKDKPWQFLKVEEGRYDDGMFQFLRLRNGDEIGWETVSIGDEPVLLRVTMTAW